MWEVHRIKGKTTGLKTSFLKDKLKILCRLIDVTRCYCLWLVEATTVFEKGQFWFLVKFGSVLLNTLCIFGSQCCIADLLIIS